MISIYNYIYIYIIYIYIYQESGFMPQWESHQVNYVSLFFENMMHQFRVWCHVGLVPTSESLWQKGNPKIQALAPWTSTTASTQVASALPWEFRDRHDDASVKQKRSKKNISAIGSAQFHGQWPVQSWLLSSLVSWPPAQGGMDQRQPKPYISEDWSFAVYLLISGCLLWKVPCAVQR